MPSTLTTIPSRARRPLQLGTGVLVLAIITVLVALTTSTPPAGAETPAERCARETAAYNQTWKQAWVATHPGTTISDAPAPTPPYVCQDPATQTPTTTTQPSVTAPSMPTTTTTPGPGDGPNINSHGATDIPAPGTTPIVPARPTPPQLTTSPDLSIYRLFQLFTPKKYKADLGAGFPDGPKLIERVNACEQNRDVTLPQYFSEFGFDDNTWTVVGMINLSDGETARPRCDAIRHMLDGDARDNNKKHDPRDNPVAFMKCVEATMRDPNSARIDPKTGNQRFIRYYAPGKYSVVWVDPSSNPHDNFREIRTVYTNSDPDDWAGCAAAPGHVNP